jgi:hypothetical protein
MFHKAALLAVAAALLSFARVPEFERVEDNTCEI